MAAEIKKEIQLEIAHVLFIDIVGYSKRLINDQRALRETLNNIVLATDQAREAEAAGRLKKIPTGDGMALVFYTSPEAPVECALEIARADIEHTELELRMGIHSGPISEVQDVNEGANVAGGGINMAQRVMDCGDAGHILLSKRVAEDLEQFAHWRPYLHDLGECEVKHGVRLRITNLYTEELGNDAVPKKLKVAARERRNKLVAGSILITAVVAAIIIFFWYRLGSHLADGSAVPEKSIAVLPFTNMSRDPDNAYFADGIQDEILTRLSKIVDLKVISRTSTQHYKSAPTNLPEIAKQLGVANILEGSVQKSGDAVRVNVQLIKAATDSHLWADTIDRKVTDIFSVESDVAKAIADQLRAKLTGDEREVIDAKPTNNPEAYDAYLRGLDYTLKTAFTPENSLGAQKYVKEAVRLDPNFALAWALLSYVDASGYLTQSLQPTVALGEKAHEAVDMALRLQPNLGEAIFAKGFYHYACLKEYDTALKYLEQAYQLMPHSSKVLQGLAYVERRRGNWDKSEVYFNEAEKLDPRNVNLLSQHARSYVCLRRFREAIAKLEQILNITPDDIDTIVVTARIAQAEGDLTRASTLLAPLHPNADDTGALETQVYQAILERRPAPMITRLKEVLAKPDPALGFFNGELRFWLGWAQEVGGDRAAAQESWRQARSELEPFLKEQPDNPLLIGDMALTNAALGDRAAALALAERAVTARPLEKDALTGPRPLEILARVTAHTGDLDGSISSLEKLLSISYEAPLAANAPLTPALLRLDPMFDPLRNDPRFQKLCDGKQP